MKNNDLSTTREATTLASTRRVVSIETPFRAATPAASARNIAYAHAAMLDSLRRGEAPFASHLLYPQILNDGLEAERRLGLDAGHMIRVRCDAVVFYIDLGISSGMIEAARLADAYSIPIEERSLNIDSVVPPGGPGHSDPSLDEPANPPLDAPALGDARPSSDGSPIPGSRDSNP